MLLYLAVIVLDDIRIELKLPPTQLGKNVRLN